MRGAKANVHYVLYNSNDPDNPDFGKAVIRR